MIYLDVSRLLTSGFRTTPSGIERIELAYADEFGGTDGLVYVAGFCGRLHVLPAGVSLAYRHALEDVWKGMRPVRKFIPILYMIFIYIFLFFASVRLVFSKRARPHESGAVYLNLSHENLRSRQMIADFKARTGTKLVCFIHDLIPITHPEYARRGQAKIHRQRIATVAALADAVLVNSAATKNALISHWQGAQHLPSVHVAHVGVANDARRRNPSAQTNGGVTPYFICLATIEPRKNHLLLLHVWRSLIEENGAAPRLIIAGRRGWENEMVVDMLERCENLSGFVEERRGVSDRELDALMSNARALLLPSFAEGYGLPAPEALHAGTPVICSDLPALREICGDVPEYLDPLDGAGWRRAILDYAQASSPRRAAQCERLGAWQAPRWDAHFGLVRNVIKEVREESGSFL